MNNCTKISWKFNEEKNQWGKKTNVQNYYKKQINARNWSREIQKMEKKKRRVRKTHRRWRCFKVRGTISDHDQVLVVMLPFKVATRAALPAVVARHGILIESSVLAYTRNKIHFSANKATSEQNKSHFRAKQKPLGQKLYQISDKFERFMIWFLFFLTIFLLCVHS